MSETIKNLREAAANSKGLDELSSFIARGANESANVLINGSVSAVYGGTSVHGAQPTEGMDVAVETTEPVEQGVVDGHLADIAASNEPAAPTQEMVTSHGVEQPSSNGPVDQHLAEIEASPPQPEPTIELEQ